MTSGFTRARVLIGVAVALFGVLALSACHHPADEVLVRQAIESTAQAAEKGSVTGVAAALTEDFDGNAGALDRRALSGTVGVFALRGEQVKVNLGPISVERRGERLVATFTVAVRAGNRLLPDNLGVYQVETAWRLDDGDWRCYGATWKQTL
jgi:hypothetical protein